MNQLRQVSTFLRQSADAAEHGAPSPALPPPAASMFARFGMTERLMRGAMMSPLLALAVAGMSMPNEAEAAAKSPDNPAISQVVGKPMKEDDIIAKIAEFKPLDIHQACVPNSELFGVWMKKNLPEVKTDQIVIQSRLRALGEAHRMVHFKAGKNDYVYDYSYGALKLPSTYKPGDDAKVLADSKRVIEAAFTGTYPQNNLGDNPSRVDRRKVHGNETEALYNAMKDDFEVARVMTNGKEFIAFVDKNSPTTRMGFYTPAVGTRMANLMQERTPAVMDQVFKQAFAALAGGSGDYSIVAGSVIKKPEAPAVAVVASSTPDVGDISL